MKVVQHNPNCAIFRRGDLHAWCDCGAEAPVLEEIRRKCWYQIGGGMERARLHRLLEQILEIGVRPKAANLIRKELEAWAEKEDEQDA